MTMVSASLCNNIQAYTRFCLFTEITNNPYSLADGTETGAQNHQVRTYLLFSKMHDDLNIVPKPECPVGRDSGNDDPSEYRGNYCDRNEGEACPRWNRAFQSYLEWLPLRKGEGRMGCVMDGKQENLM